MMMSPIVISFQRRKKLLKKYQNKEDGGEDEDEAKRIFWIWTGHFPTVRSRWSLEWIYNYLSQLCIYSIYSIYSLDLLKTLLERELFWRIPPSSSPSPSYVAQIRSS